MGGGKTLADLNTPAMPMHVAKPTDVHQNVEPELLSGTEGAQHLVMFTTVSQAKVDDLALHLGTESIELVSNLAIGILTVLVQQRSGELKFQRIVVEQIDQSGATYGRLFHQI